MTTFLDTVLNETRAKKFADKTEHGKKEAIRKATGAERASLIASMGKPKASETEKREVNRTNITKPTVKAERPTPKHIDPAKRVPDLVHRIDRGDAMHDTGAHHYQHHLEMAHDHTHNWNHQHHDTHLDNTFAHLHNAHQHAHAIYHTQIAAARQVHQGQMEQLRHHPEVQRMRKETVTKSTKGGFLRKSKSFEVPKHREAQIQQKIKELDNKHGYTRAFEERKNGLNSDYHRRRSEIGNVHARLIKDHVTDLASAEHHLSHIRRNNIAHKGGPMEKAFRSKLKPRHADILYGKLKKRTGLAKRIMGETTEKFIQHDPPQKPAEIGTDELLQRYADATPGQTLSVIKGLAKKKVGTK